MKYVGIVLLSWVARTTLAAAIARPPEIARSRQPGIDCGPKRCLWQASNQAKHDALVQIGVRLEADAHQRASGLRFLASASFW